MIKNKRIVIFGGAGSIGSELSRQLSIKNKIYIVDFNETACFDLMTDLGVPGRIGDIRDENTVREVFDDFKPQVVFHAAAYKHVTPMEATPLEAIKTNVVGTYNILQYSKIYPVEKFVYISTDKAVQSNSIMGATKRLGEIMVKNSGKGYVTVRFGNVLGSRGSVIPIWQRQIDAGKALTVTDSNMKRFFMTIEEACTLVIEAGSQGVGGEIYVLDMGKQVNILALAKDLVKSLGREVPIEMIGLRAGETLEEKIMFEEEEHRAIKSGNYYIIK